jgi:Cysteine rich repeat
MSINSKWLALSVGLVASLACCPSVLAQPQQAPTPGAPQFQFQRKDAQQQPSPLRDFQQMIEGQRSQLQSRIAAGAERVQAACREEVQNFCSKVTPGEGRLMLCMQAHEDKLSNQCEVAMLEASRNAQQAMRRVERVAEACWTDIQNHCVGAPSVAQCMNEKRSVLSARCQAVVADLRPTPQRGAQPKPSLVGLPIYSSDGVKMGEVIGVKAGLDGRPQMIHAEIGSLLGLGTSNVLITPDELQASRTDGLQLRMPAEQVRAVLQEQLYGQK